MPYTSEYSLKSVQEAPSHHSGSSSGKRLINLLRSLFSLSPKQDPEISQKKYASISPRPAPVSLKRRKIESPVRSTSQYENLSNFRDLTAPNNYSNMTHSTTQLPKPSPPVIPYRGCNQRQFYSPQIRHANNSNFYAQSSGIQDIKIVNLDPWPTQLVRTFSYRRPGERYVIQSDRRPIYSESVEVNISDPVTFRVTQQPSAMINQKYLLPSAVSGASEKKVVSVANIPMETQYIRPQMCISNASEKEIVLKREYSDTFNQQMECSSKDESRRKMEIKERILAEWEHSWRPEERKLDGSFSSLGTNREEPSMVDDELKVIPSPTLRTNYSPHYGSGNSRKSDWETIIHDGVSMREDHTVYEGDLRDLNESKIITWRIHDNRWPEQRNVSSVQRGHSFSNGYDPIVTDRLAKYPKRYKEAHTVSLSSYLNKQCKKGVNNFSPLYQRDVQEEEKWLHNDSTLSVPHDNPEKEYEFALTEKILLLCPQSVPLPRKAVGPTVINHSDLQSKDISNKTESNFSIDNLSQLSISGFTSRCESETRVTIPTSTYSMARLRQRNTSQDVADQSPNAPILATSNHLFHADHNNLGDILKNDSIDLGETGRVNYRTGSFLGRFTDHSGESTRNRKVEIATNSQQTRSGQTLNDYMVSGQLNESVTSAPENNYNNPSLTRHSPVKRPLPKVPIEPSKTAELDPVLSLLLSDVSQLDELRNNFRDKSVRCSKSVKTTSSSAPQNNQNESTSRSKERKLSANMKPTSPPIIKQEDVDEAQRELTSKIHDLVDLECSSKAKKSEQMKKLSYKDRSTKEPPKDDKGFSFLRVRQHQFRWSERHQRPSPYSALRPPEEVGEKEIVPALKESTKLVDFTKEKAEPASRIISMLVPHMQDGIPIWVFSAGQLNVLRRMAQTQITLTQEEVCPSNRLIKWRVSISFIY